MAIRGNGNGDRSASPCPCSCPSTYYSLPHQISNAVFIVIPSSLPLLHLTEHDSPGIKFPPLSFLPNKSFDWTFIPHTDTPRLPSTPPGYYPDQKPQITPQIPLISLSQMQITRFCDKSWIYVHLYSSPDARFPCLVFPPTHSRTVEIIRFFKKELITQHLRFL